jgi:NTE family protein
MQKKIGLALGSGAARGLAHIGVLKVLNSAGIPVDAISGTSSGALIGGLFASGMSISQMEEIAGNTDWLLITRMLIPSLRSDGVVSGKALENFLQALIGNGQIQDFKIPFTCFATDLMSGDEIELKSGSVVGAIRASMSIPGLISPYAFENRLLVDGGLVNPIPVKALQKFNVDIKIGVIVTPPQNRLQQKLKIKSTPKSPFPSFAQSSKMIRERLDYYLSKLDLKKKEKAEIKSVSVLNTMIQSWIIMQNQLIQSQLRESEPDIIIQPDVTHFQLLDFTKASAIIKAGEAATIEKLEEIKLKLDY